MKTEILPTIGEKMQSIKRDKQATADFIAKSNPSLVCAAPELLAAIERIAGYADGVTNTTRAEVDISWVAKVARAAIAKAEGNL